MSDFSRKGAVVHQEHFQIGNVFDQEFLESIGHQVAGLGVGAVANLGHGDLSLESTTDSVINTFGFSP